MAINIENLIRKDIFGWFSKNVDIDQLSNLPSSKEFWITPLEESHPEYSSVIPGLIDRIKKTVIGAPRFVEGLALVVVLEGDVTYVCGLYLDGRRSLVLSDNPIEGLRIAELSFLQRMAVISKVNAKARSNINSNVWQMMPIFESDLEEFLPKMIFIEVDAEQAKDVEEILVLKFLLSLDLPAKNILDFRSDLVDLMLAIPQKDHEWLLKQVLWSAMAGRNTSFFIELYRIVEFFFPLSKISKLKEVLKFSGTDMELLSACSSSLGWNVNHALGSRLALNFANTDFAEIALARSYGGESEDSARKFKEDAMEKITELRHSLVHQSFRDSSTDEGQLARYTQALLNFLFTSFSAYTENEGKNFLEDSAVTA